MRASERIAIWNDALEKAIGELRFDRAHIEASSDARYVIDRLEGRLRKLMRAKPVKEPRAAREPPDP